MRDYDPTTGRYLEPDPLGLVDGASVYGYVRGNPGRWIDSKGTNALSWAGDWAWSGIKGGVTIGGQIYGGALIALGMIMSPTQLGDDTLSDEQWDKIHKNESKNQWVSDPQAAKDYDAYKDAYRAPPPPNLDKCELLRWKLRREQALLLARQLWDAKWSPGRHAQAIEQSRNAVKNTKRVLIEAGCDCP